MKYSFDKIKKELSKRVNVWMLLIVLMFSIIICYLDTYLDGKLFLYISNNMISKIATTFLSIGGFVSIFFPFTYKKGISANDITNISKETLKKENEENEKNERLNRQATF